MNLQKLLNWMSLRNSKYKQNYASEISIDLHKKTKNTPKTTQNKENKQKTIDHTKPICCICYQSSDKIKYINCKRGGIQDNCIGRGSSCCKDKPICNSCRKRCRESCPFCRNHKLYNIKTERYPKKKLPFKEREAQRLLKLAKKNKKKKKKKTIKRINHSGFIDLIPPSYFDDNIFSSFYSSYNYTSSFY